MGCGSSKASGLSHVDDSVHVMLNHDKKVQQRKGEPVHGFKPRAEHPLLKEKANATATHTHTHTHVCETSDAKNGDAAVAAAADTTANGNATKGAVTATES